MRSSIWPCRSASRASMEVAQGDVAGRPLRRPRRSRHTTPTPAAPQPAELLVGRLRLRYMLETEDRAGFLCIGLARVTEVTSDRRVIAG